MTVECPWCEFEGRVDEVEAHISGSVDEAHRGRVGYDLREYLPQTEQDGESSGDGGSGSRDGLGHQDGATSAVSGKAILAATLLMALVVVGRVQAAGSEEQPEEDQDGGGLDGA